jgi:hypothetical protein
MSNKTSDKILSNKKLSNINIVEQKIVEQNIIGHQHCQSKWYSPIKYLTPIVGSLTKIGEVTVHMIGHPIVMQKNLTHPSSKMFNWKKVCQKISLFFSLVTLQLTRDCLHRFLETEVFAPFYCTVRVKSLKFWLS